MSSATNSHKKINSSTRPASTSINTKTRISRNSHVSLLNSTKNNDLGKVRNFANSASQGLSREQMESVKKKRRNYNLLSGMPKGINQGKYGDLINSLSYQSTI